MGCFSCFDSKKEEKSNPQKVGADRPEVQPSAPSNISRLTSGKFIVFCLFVMMLFMI